MSLAAPLALLLLALAAPVAWAFLARRKAPRAIVGSVLLLRAAAAKAQARRVAPRLREPLALLLTLLTLVAIAVSLAGPGCGSSADGRLVIVVDGSASMGRSTPEGASVLAAGADAIAEAVRAHDGEVALIVARDRAEVAVGLTRDPDLVTDALRGIEAFGSDDGLADALRLAAALCADPVRDRVVLLGQHAPDDFESTCPLYRAPLPATGPNTGVAELAARRGDGLGLIEVLVGIASDEERAVEIAFRVEGRLVDTARVDVRPDRTAYTLRRLESDGSRVEVELLDNVDALAADDRAWVDAGSREPIRVALVTDAPQGFVATALRLHPGVSLRLVPAEASATLTDVELLVLEAAATPPPSLPVLAIGADAAAVLGLARGDSAESPTIARWAFDDPRLAFVDLDGVVITRAAPLRAPDGADVLIVSDAGPLLVQANLGGRWAAALGFGALDSDLALRPGFLHLLANLVEDAVPRTVVGERSSATGGPDEVRRPTPGALAAVSTLGPAGSGGWAWARWALLFAWVALVGESALSAALGVARRRVA